MDDSKLIDLVHSFPHLYDKKRADFKDTLKKKNSWTEIAKLMKCSVDDAMARWKYLREKYLRCRKKLPSGSAAPTNPDSDWEYYPALKWLDNYISSRKSKSNWMENATEVGQESQESQIDEFSQELYEEDSIELRPGTSDEASRPASAESSQEAASPKLLVAVPQRRQTPKRSELNRKIADSIENIDTLSAQWTRERRRTRTWIVMNCLGNR